MAVKLEIIRELVEAGPFVETQPASPVEAITSPYELPTDWRIDFEERAAILEYDGGLTREQADMQALREIQERIRNLKKVKKFKFSA